MVARYSIGVRPVALLTDFGLADHYVGVLHAVLEREAPGVRRIDIGHQVPPGDVVLLECSSGLLELAVNRGSAAALTGLGRGDGVDVTSDE
jgi:S-adenosylmethionine hydrolase